MKLTLAAAAFALLAPFAIAQSGHWEGSIAVPDHALQIIVDLAPGQNDAWKGTIAIPAQPPTGSPSRVVSRRPAAPPPSA